MGEIPGGGAAASDALTLPRLTAFLSDLRDTFLTVTFLFV